MSDEIEAADPRHLKVGDDKIDRVPFKERDGIRDIGGSEDLVSLGGQVSLEKLQGVRASSTTRIRSLLAGDRHRSLLHVLKSLNGKVDFKSCSLTDLAFNLKSPP